MKGLHNLYWTFVTWLYLKRADYEFWRMMRERRTTKDDWQRLK